MLDLESKPRHSYCVKAFIFLVFSILIHCYILRFTLSGNSQESLFEKPFLRQLKSQKITKDSLNQKRHQKSKTEGIQEPQLFAPKKLSPNEISRLNFRDGLIYLIQSKTTHPSLDQDLEQYGTVIVNVELDKNGNILSSKVDTSSGHDSLDQAALNATNSVKVYKPLPRVLHPYATFLIPIHFF